jgi:hypothetical protein
MLRRERGLGKAGLAGRAQGIAPEHGTVGAASRSAPGDTARRSTRAALRRLPRYSSRGASARNAVSLRP